MFSLDFAMERFKVLKSKCIVGGDNGGQHHFPQGTSINFPLIELVLLSICAGKNLAFRHCLSFMQHLKKKGPEGIISFYDGSSLAFIKLSG